MKFKMNYIININFFSFYFLKKKKKSFYLNQKASLTYSKDGFIHFNDHIMLLNEKVKGVLGRNLGFIQFYKKRIKKKLKKKNITNKKIITKKDNSKKKKKKSKKIITPKKEEI